MEITEEDRARLREAWNEYCDALRQQGLDILDGKSGDPRDARELAEALRAVARIGIMSLQHRIDFNDPDFPTFFRTMDDRYKYGGPDAYITYLAATLRGDATYRLRANHRHREFNVNVSAPVPVRSEGGTRLALGNRELWSREMQVAEDGSLEVTFGAVSAPGNWMPLDPAFRGGTELPDQYPMAAGGLMLRTYYWDPDDDLPAGEFHIERIDARAPSAPAPLSTTSFAAQLRSAAELSAKAAKWWIARASRMRMQSPVNRVAPLGKQPPGVENFTPPKTGPLNYGVCAYELAPDEALVVDTDITPARYWSFQLYNAWWEAPDVQHRQTSLGFRQAHLDADGRFRCVLAHSDPGVPNWLDTGGNARGFLFYRWLWPESDLPSPTGRVVKLDQVRALLPAEHPRIDAATRRRQLSARRAWFARRFQA